MKAKKIYSIALFVSLLVLLPQLIKSQNLPEVVIISDVVGSLIDSTEKTTYCLFAEYSDKDFSSAQFIKSDDGNIQAIVYLKNKKIDKKIISQELFIEYQKQINKRPVKYSDIDMSYIYSVLLLDETEVYGTFKELKDKEIIFITNYSDTLTLPKIKILKLEKKMSISDSKKNRWFENPHDSRHFFAPTARNLQKGEGYFQDIYLFVAAVNYGITDNVTIGGGMSIVPFMGFENQILFLTPKIGYKLNDKLNVGGGILYANTSDFTDYDFRERKRASTSIIYGVGTYGSKENNITLGIGYAGYKWKFQEYPIVVLGGMYRISRRAALVTENWFALIDYEISNEQDNYVWNPEWEYIMNDGIVTYEQVNNEPMAIISYGVRFFSEKICVDLGFFNGLGKFKEELTGSDKFFFPGIPYLDFVVKF